MKKLKRLAVFAAALALLMCMTALCACDDSDSVSLEGTMKIVMVADSQSEATVIEADLKGFTSKNSVMDVLDKLADDKKLCYKANKGFYGMYLTALGVPASSEYNGETSYYDSFILEEDTAAHKSLYTYTSVDVDKLETEAGASYAAQTVEYDGQTLTESMNGVSKMTICDGAVIYFTYLIW